MLFVVGVDIAVAVLGVPGNETTDQPIKIFFEEMCGFVDQSKVRFFVALVGGVHWLPLLSLKSVVGGRSGSLYCNKCDEYSCSAGDLLCWVQ